MNDQRTTQVAREKALYQYTSALDRGDFEAVAEILQIAEADPELTTMIEQMNDNFRVAQEQQFAAQKRRQPMKERTKPHFKFSLSTLVSYGMVVFLVAVVGIAVLTLQGARIGNVYSGPVNALGGGSGPAALPTMPPESTTSLLEMTPQPMGTPTPQMAVHLTQAPGTSAPTLGPAQGSPVAPQEPMIIKNGEIELIVEDTQSAIDQVTNIATDNGGYVLSSQSSALNGRATAIMTIAVRAENFEIAMRRLRDISMEVLRETSSGQDVSTEYVDLQSRLRNLEATRDRIRALLDQATTVEDALEINTQLSTIEAEIEQVKGRMTYLTGRAAFSTITVTLNEYIPTTPTPTPTPTLTPTPTSPWSLGPRIDAAVETQKSMGRSLLELLVWLIIVPGPYLVGLALIVWIVRTVSRRRQP
jgi:hypothetical protein